MRRSLQLLAIGLLVGFIPWTGTASGPEPILYTVRVPTPASQVAEIEVTVPAGKRASVELMMPIWSPGFYRIEDYASRVLAISARTPAGARLVVEKTRNNRWRIGANGASSILVSYRLQCTQRSVTTNWVSPELGVLNGAATFMTLADAIRRPHDVRIELPPAWKQIMTGLDAATDGKPNHYRAADYETLVDSPIVAGDLAIHKFRIDRIPHYLVDAGDKGQWNGERAAQDLEKIVRESLLYWGSLPYKRYVFLNVFRPGGGGLEHKNSALLTANSSRASTEAGYHSWLEFVAHEYFHAFNVKRLRPVELGPFNYESEPRTSSLWISEGFTSYFGDLLVARASLSKPQEFLAGISSQIDALQKSPGRLVQTLEQSSVGVWTNSTSGVNPTEATVSYYVKGQVLAFLLDARIRTATRGARSLDDAMKLAYKRYGGQRGFTPDEFRRTVESVAGSDLREWFRKAVSSTEELDYTEALQWFGLGLAPAAWKLEVREDATKDQTDHLRRLLACQVCR